MVEIKFILTGFGPFGGVEENPTQSILQEIANHIENNAAVNSAIATSSITTILIDTCAQDARVQVDKLYETIELNENRKYNDCVTVVLHFGVNVYGKFFQIEKCAYNEASFRIPDQRQYQPVRAKIVQDHWLGSRINSTSLDVGELCQTMNAEFGTLNTVVSTDPGRFVCNYTYCYSLHTLRRKFGHDVDSCALFTCIPKHLPKERQRAHCLFLHVPPLEVCSLPDQLCYVSCFMDHISRALAKDETDDKRSTQCFC